MLTPVIPSEKGFPHFRNIYLSQVKATNVQEFISISGTSDSLRLENFYLHAIEAQAQKAGMIRFTRNFNATEIKLAVPEPHSMLLEENEQSNVQIEYVRTVSYQNTAENQAN